MDLNDLRSLVTLVGFVLFIGLMAWTWRPAGRAANEAAALLPFGDEQPAAEPTAAAAGAGTQGVTR